ncbi:MAG: Na+/H+ antiporter subunit E [Lawsonella sp.]|uniref:Na+/H+ antiporter subunit E n=1 Tax=Lawsonella sp. TaxID=2041415 RepID=UPI0025FBD76E|nr:Na+/H+ antiporter subunit E [Lawsonella sp.]MDY2978791.1 Na+/H+ antiporter subunit E [Lawsonella sp.]
MSDKPRNTTPPRELTDAELCEQWEQQERAEDMADRESEETHLREERSSSFSSAAMTLVRAVWHLIRRPRTAGRRFVDFFASAGRWLAYGAWLLAEVAINADGMALDMFRPNTKISPAILRIPLERMNSLEVTVFATSITLTPGTLVLAIDRGSARLTMTLDGVAVSGDDGFLLVHSVYAEDLDAVRDELEIMMNKVLRASRGKAYEPHRLEVTAA